MELNSWEQRGKGPGPRLDNEKRAPAGHREREESSGRAPGQETACISLPGFLGFFFRCPDFWESWRAGLGAAARERERGGSGARRGSGEGRLRTAQRWGGEGGYEERWGAPQE